MQFGNLKSQWITELRTFKTFKYDADGLIDLEKTHLLTLILNE